MPIAPYKSVSECFLNRVAATPDKEAFRYARGSAWESQTWKQTLELVKAVSGGLRALGVNPEDRVAIMSGTRFEWILADLGIMCAAGATTTVYPSSTDEDAAYILNDSGTVVVIAETEAHVASLVAHRASLTSVRKIVTFDGKAGHDGFVITWKDLLELGRAENKKDAGAFETRARSPKPEHLATLIYTSGTTGKPKGVELTHDNWVYESEAMDAIGILSENDLQYLWLPMAHSFGKVLQAGQLRIGYATAVDGRIDKLVENLSVVQPTFVAAVPRIFEKVHNKVVQGAKDGGGAKWNIFQWALGVGRQVSQLRQNKQEPGGLLSIKFALADKLVFSKLRARFGGRVRLFISGSAPLSRYLAEFFHAAGLPIMEGYGLTETSAASFVNIPQRFKFGTVGHPLPGTEVKIAEDGEILIRGRGLMRSYHNLPEATAETLKAGYLHTGDIGEVDADGFLRITDRKKELIKTSGGKYVAPTAIEGKFKIVCPYVSQMVVHGDNRNYCVALIALDVEAAPKWAKDNGLGDLNYKQLSEHPAVIKMVGEHIDRLNAELANYESIKKFKMLPADLTIDSGDLTPSQKLKRKAVEKKYKALLDGMYEAAVDKV